VANAIVVLVPESPLRDRLDLYKTAASEASGRYRITGIAPGDYQLFSWERVQTGAWHDPAFMRDMEGKGQRVHLPAGERVQISATVHP
jgi:hypothetical protein